MVKHLPANTEVMRDACSISESGISPGGGNANPFQYFCLENSMERGVWYANLWGQKQSDMTEQLSTTNAKKHNYQEAGV